MRILVCTSQVPFERGGAEALSDGLCHALREHGHDADVVALPYSWTPRDRLFNSALAWRLLDLQTANGQPVDAIICTKFPSYAAKHDRKIVWLVHQHRQAYDWRGTALSDWGAQPGDDQALDLLQRLDRRTLGEAHARFAISRNVAARLQRFNRLPAQVVYPPSPLMPKIQPGPFGDYVLSVARLDRAKRIDLLLEALALAQVPLRVVIAGRGPDEARLRKLASALKLGDRVRFAGYVGDDEAAELYAHARAVFYAPVDEDYGFATIEAFAANKPVLTTTDAGGVLEFVEHDVSGLIAAPQPAAVATALHQIADPQTAERLGAGNRERVTHIRWEHLVSTLLGTASAST
jgi:glycosyltransferase involved in cell wall biosynthesis